MLRPARTDELVLHNLDMEMQLLKKKRELLERQLNSGPDMEFQNNYNQAPSNSSYQPQSNTQMGYKNIQQRNQNNYNQAPSISSYQPQSNTQMGYRNVQQRKRQNVSPWQNEPLPKLVRTNNQGEASWFEPNQTSYSPKRFHQPKKNKRQNAPFVPKKVEKNRPKPVNKFNTYALPVQKTLVKEPVKLTKKAQIDDDFYANDILHPDQVPTQKMTGRLELALGTILKEIKTEYSNVAIVTRLLEIQASSREMKLTIRERLRDLLLGKPVPHFTKIRDIYRQHYPIESDAELINTISQKHQLKDIIDKKQLKFTPTDEPQKFVNHNYKKIVCNKLREMFGELETIYQNKSEEEMMKSTALDDVFIKRKVNDPQANEEAKDVEGDVVININKPYNEMSVKEKLYYCKKHINEVVNAHLPSLLSTVAEDITNLLVNQDGMDLLKGSLLTRLNPKYSRSFPKQGKIDETTPNLEMAPIKEKYYARISCHPSLPKREQMQKYLHSFKPSAIKKPKNSFNIILVLFNTREERESLLAANGTVLFGKYHLNIVPAESAHTQQTVPKSIESIKNVDMNASSEEPASNVNEALTHSTNSESGKEYIKPNNEDSTPADDKSDESCNKSAEPSNKDIELDNKDLSHAADSETGIEVIKPDKKENDPSNGKDSEPVHTDIENESSMNDDLIRNGGDNSANTSVDCDIINSDLDKQIDDLLTSVTKQEDEKEPNSESESADSKIDQIATADSKMDQIATVVVDDDSKNSSNDEVGKKINEDVKTDDTDMPEQVSTAEDNSAIVIEDSDEAVENNPEDGSDEVKSAAVIDSNEDTNSEVVKENENSPKSESAPATRVSSRVATRRSSRFVNN